MPKKYKKKGDYDVGFKKPPKATQWPPGQSGNPSGKKSKDESLRAKLMKIASEELVVTKNGQTVVMTYLEAVAYAAFAKAQSGSAPHIKILMSELGQDLDAIVTPPSFELTDADLAAMESHAEWLQVIEEAKNEVGDGEEPHDDDTQTE